MRGRPDCCQIMNARTTGTLSAALRRPSGDARVDRLTGDVRLAIGSRIEAMRLHRAALAEQDRNLWEEPDRTIKRVVRRVAPKRLTDELRRQMP
jgi:hypothetical protein